MDALPKCAWCTGGACIPTCEHTKGTLDAGDVTAVTNRSITYWHAPSRPLLQADASVRLGVIVHHGSARNGDDYFCSMYNGLVRRFGHEIRSVLLISAQIYEPQDKPTSSELYWDADADPDHNWKWGGNSSSTLPASLSSFSVLDMMVEIMMNTSYYPSLRTIVVAGHSAGGQIVQRYALASGLWPRAGVAIRYFPANPSSYTYLTSLRPEQRSPWSCEGFCDNTTLLHRNWSFARPAPPAVAACPYFDAYGYGLSGHLPPYLAARGVAAMVRAFGQRSVTFLSGSSDVCDEPFMRKAHCTPGCDPYDGGLDTSCEAYLQGKCRMHRAHAYAQYTRLLYAGAAPHRLVAIPDVGHSGCAVFQSPAALAAMFPKERLNG